MYRISLMSTLNRFFLSMLLFIFGYLPNANTSCMFNKCIVNTIQVTAYTVQPISCRSVLKCQMIHFFLNFPLHTFDNKRSVLSNYNSIPRCKFIIRNLLQASNEKVWGKSNAMGLTPRVGSRHGLYAKYFSQNERLKILFGSFLTAKYLRY